MICFRIPQDNLRHFLVTLDMNFNIKEPKYIFHVDKNFEIVLTERPAEYVINTLDQLADSYKKEVKPSEISQKEKFLVSASEDLIKAIVDETSHIPVSQIPRIAYCTNNARIALKAYE